MPDYENFNLLRDNESSGNVSYSGVSNLIINNDSPAPNSVLCKYWNLKLFREVRR